MANKEVVHVFPLFNGSSFLSFHNIIFVFLKLEISMFVKELANIIRVCRIGFHVVMLSLSHFLINHLLFCFLLQFPEVIESLFMLNLAEHEISTAHE